jgi:hypothetical protein
VGFESNEPTDSDLTIVNSSEFRFFGHAGYNVRTIDKDEPTDSDKPVQISQCLI